MERGKRDGNVYKLCECAILIALALALSYLKIPIGLSFGGFGGSIDLVMVPLIVLALRRGLPLGVLAGAVFGTLKYFLAAGFAVSWVSIIFDYSVAYAACGLAGLFKNNPEGRYGKYVAGTVIACLARFAVHYLSGVTVYAMYMPESFMELTMTSPAFYSLLYNGTYMLPNTLLAVIICPLVMKALKKANI